jgi:putative FmdB family regulatory protein
MPIYAYRCEACGHAKDVIQKFSDAPLTACPECGADAFRKQLTAPAFQLKGSGWYVTDFRDNGKKAKKPDAAPADAKADAKADAAKPAESGPAKAAEPAAAPPAAAPAPSAPKSTPET